MSVHCKTDPLLVPNRFLKVLPCEKHFVLTKIEVFSEFSQIKGNVHRELTIYSPYFRSDNRATNYSIYSVKDFVFPPFVVLCAKNKILLYQYYNITANVQINNKNLPCRKTAGNCIYDNTRLGAHPPSLQADVVA